MASIIVTFKLWSTKFQDILGALLGTMEAKRARRHLPSIITKQVHLLVLYFRCKHNDFVQINAFLAKKKLENYWSRDYALKIQPNMLVAYVTKSNVGKTM